MKYKQNSIDTGVALTALERDRHIEQFYTFCDSKLEKYVAKILNLYHSYKLNEYNLSE